MTSDVEDLVRRQLQRAAASTPEAEELIERIKGQTIRSDATGRRSGHLSRTLVGLATAIAVICLLGAVFLVRHDSPQAVDGDAAGHPVGLPLSSAAALTTGKPGPTSTDLDKTSATTLLTGTALPTSPTPHATGKVQEGGWRLLGAKGHDIYLLVIIGSSCDSLDYMRVVESDSSITITPVILHNQPAGVICPLNLRGTQGFVTLAEPLGDRRLIHGTT